MSNATTSGAATPPAAAGAKAGGSSSAAGSGASTPTPASSAAAAAAGAAKPTPPPNAWFARGKGGAAGAAAGAGSKPGTPSQAASPASSAKAAGAASSAAPAQAPTKGQAGSSVSAPAAGQPPSASAAGSGPTKDLASLFGKALKITTNSGSTAEGLLWCFDASSGSVVLETAAQSSGSGSGADLSGTPYSAAYTNANPYPRRLDASAPKASFRILKARDVRSVETLSAASAQALGLPRTLSVIDQAVAAPAAAEAREQAAIREVQAKVAKIGKGVSAEAQSIFDGLSKTLPCRWHEQHIIVMDSVIVHGPEYDTQRTTVPGLTHEQLRALADGAQTSLPPKMPASEAKAKANSWSRVIKVLEGERRKLQARQAALPT